MEINIGKDYRITSDQYCYALQKKTIAVRGKKKGEVIFSNLGYYPNLEQVFRAMVAKDIMSKDLKGAKRIIKRMNKIYKKIDESLLEIRNK